MSGKYVHPRILRFPPPLKLTATIWPNMLKMALNSNQSNPILHFRLRSSLIVILVSKPYYEIYLPKLPQPELAQSTKQAEECQPSWLILVPWPFVFVFPSSSMFSWRQQPMHPTHTERLLKWLTRADDFKMVLIFDAKSPLHALQYDNALLFLTEKKMFSVSISSTANENRFTLLNLININLICKDHKGDAVIEIAYHEFLKTVEGVGALIPQSQVNPTHPDPGRRVRCQGVDTPGRNRPINHKWVRFLSKLSKHNGLLFRCSAGTKPMFCRYPRGYFPKLSQ